MKIEFWGKDGAERDGSLDRRPHYWRRAWGQVETEGKSLWFQVIVHPEHDPEILYYGLKAVPTEESPSNWVALSALQNLREYKLPNIPDVDPTFDMDRRRLNSLVEAVEEARALFVPRKGTFVPQRDITQFPWFAYRDFDPEPEGWDVEIDSYELQACIGGPVGTEYRVTLGRFRSIEPYTAQSIVNAAPPEILEYFKFPPAPVEEAPSSKEEYEWWKNNVRAFMAQAGLEPYPEDELERLAVEFHDSNKDSNGWF